MIKLSALVCIYGLFMLYRAMHDLLEKYGPTMKFASLKLVVLLMVYQEWFVSWMVEGVSLLHNDCLAVPGLEDAYAVKFQKTNEERLTSMWLIAMESMLVAHLV